MNMTRWVRACLLAVAVGGGLTACGGAPKVSDYAQEVPVLDLRQYLNGEVRAHGIFTDRAGKVVKRFTVQMVGRWDGDTGVLDEAFTYSDGSTGRRVWYLTQHSDGRVTGRADDVVGTATGQLAGNTLHWTYTLQLPVDGQVYEVQMDDWMHLVDRQVMLNRTRMSKWGIHLGDVTLSFYKP